MEPRPRISIQTQADPGSDSHVSHTSEWQSELWWLPPIGIKDGYTEALPMRDEREDFRSG